MILHPLSLHPVVLLGFPAHPALLSAPPQAALLLHQCWKKHTHTPALWQAGPQGPGFGPLGFAQTLSAASPSPRTPSVLLQISFSRQQLQQSVALQKH